MSHYNLSDISEKMRDIERHPQVAISFQAGKHVLGRPGTSISVEGKGEVIRDKDAFRKHWSKQLDRWFKDGVDTPGLVMIKVHARRVHYWDGMDEGEIPVDSETRLID
jgi:general stress protein 26